MVTIISNLSAECTYVHMCCERKSLASTVPAPDDSERRGGEGEDRKGKLLALFVQSCDPGGPQLQCYATTTQSRCQDDYDDYH